MRGLLLGLASLLSLAVLVTPLDLRAAEQTTVRAVLPWDGAGRIFHIGTDTLLFLGAIDGVIYVETATGEFDQAFAQCPITQKLVVSTGQTSASGYCMITQSPEDTVFAELSCEGQVGGCEGVFTVTGGTGRFDGISGSSRMIVRSPLQALARDVGSGSELRVTSGIMLLPELTFTIPGKR